MPCPECDSPAYGVSMASGMCGTGVFRHCRTCGYTEEATDSERAEWAERNAAVAVGR